MEEFSPLQECGNGRLVYLHFLIFRLQVMLIVKMEVKYLDENWSCFHDHRQEEFNFKGECGTCTVFSDIPSPTLQEGSLIFLFLMHLLFHNCRRCVVGHFGLLRY